MDINCITVEFRRIQPLIRKTRITFRADLDTLGDRPLDAKGAEISSSGAEISSSGAENRVSHLHQPLTFPVTNIDKSSLIIQFLSLA